MQKVQRDHSLAAPAEKRGCGYQTPSKRCGAVSRTVMISPTATMVSSALRPASLVHVAGSSFSWLPMTASTSAMSCHDDGSIWAAQPVTQSAPRDDHGGADAQPDACFSASAVTAQVLTMIVSARPADSLWRLITSLSQILRRHPKD